MMVGRIILLLLLLSQQNGSEDQNPHESILLYGPAWHQTFSSITFEVD